MPGHPEEDLTDTQCPSGQLGLNIRSPVKNKFKFSPVTSFSHRHTFTFDEKRHRFSKDRSERIRGWRCRDRTMGRHVVYCNPDRLDHNSWPISARPKEGQSIPLFAIPNSYPRGPTVLQIRFVFPTCSLRQRRSWMGDHVELSDACFDDAISTDQQRRWQRLKAV